MKDRTSSSENHPNHEIPNVEFDIDKFFKLIEASKDVTKPPLITLIAIDIPDELKEDPANLYAYQVFINKQKYYLNLVGFAAALRTLSREDSRFLFLQEYSGDEKWRNMAIKLLNATGLDEIANRIPYELILLSPFLFFAMYMSGGFRPPISGENNNTLES